VADHRGGAGLRGCEIGNKTAASDELLKTEEALSLAWIEFRKVYIKASVFIPDNVMKSIMDDLDLLFDQEAEEEKTDTVKVEVLTAIKKCVGPASSWTWNTFDG
jgi:hypothetical protein